MTRDEIVAKLQTALDTGELARVLCHDAFDSFVAISVEASHDFPPLTAALDDGLLLNMAWQWFQLGWESRS